MRCARSPKTLPCCHIHAFIPAHSRSQNVFHHFYQRVHASAFKPPHSRSTYAATFTPHLCSSTDLCCSAHTALTLQHSRHSILSPLSRRSICAVFSRSCIFYSSIHAAACTEQHLCHCSHAAAFMPQHLCCCIHAAAFFRRSHAAALMPSHLRCHIYAAAFAPEHARSHITAAFTESRSSHSAALMPSLSRHSNGVAALMLQHLCSTLNAIAFLGAKPHAAAFTLSHLRCCSRTAALTLQLSRGGSAGGSGPLGEHFPTQSTTPAGGSWCGQAQGGEGKFV